MRGAICEGFVCQHLLMDDEPPATADITYLKFGGTWYRLYFEFQSVFWRTFKEQLLPWEDDETSTAYANVGKRLGIDGQCLVSYRTNVTATGSEVTFTFADGLVVVIRDSDDRTFFEVAGRVT